MARTPQPPEPADPRERIVAAARERFMLHGFRSVTTDDLAHDLGISKKTLYAHFASKTELLEAVIEHKFREVETDMARTESEFPDDFIAGLRAFLALLQRHTEELRPPFVRDMARAAPELFERVRVRRGKLIQQHFGALIAAGRRDGLIRKDIPVPLIIEILLTATQTIVVPQRMAELNMTPREGFTAILKLVLEGALTPEARSRL